MARLLQYYHAFAMAIAPVIHAQTLLERAAATITSMGPAITDTAAFEGYISLVEFSSCESPPKTFTRASFGDRILTTAVARLAHVLRPGLYVQIVRRVE
jgi:hypothetical protein